MVISTVSSSASNAITTYCNTYHNCDTAIFSYLFAVYAESKEISLKFSIQLEFLCFSLHSMDDIVRS